MLISWNMLRSVMEDVSEPARRIQNEGRSIFPWTSLNNLSSHGLWGLNFPVLLDLSVARGRQYESIAVVFESVHEISNTGFY